MISRLLQTKFHTPVWKMSAVSRPRLLGHLNVGWQEGRKLTLVSAPAGYGKTTLVTEWIHSILGDHKSAVQLVWLSLDEGDHDPARFLTYFIAALQSVDETLGQGAPSLLGIPQLPPLPAILDELINDLVTQEERIILFLDDYHVINNPKLHEALEYFMDHMPFSFHMAITTRADPLFH